MFGLHLCLLPPVYSASRGQRSKGVETVTVVSHHVGSETQTQVLWKSRALIRGAVSVAPFTQLSKRVLEIQLGISKLTPQALYQLSYHPSS